MTALPADSFGLRNCETAKLAPLGLARPPQLLRESLSALPRVSQSKLSQKKQSKPKLWTGNTTVTTAMKKQINQLINNV